MVKISQTREDDLQNPGLLSRRLVFVILQKVATQFNELCCCITHHLVNQATIGDALAGCLDRISIQGARGEGSEEVWFSLVAKAAS